ncbi:hypothetical protein ZWY2020_036718 [Hordeum vulgare]|nr:hypothetical protein ZWY2020_036718 [Hordeum vulgare]
MRDGRRRRRRRKDSPRVPPPERDIDAVPDELLELVFLRLTSPVHLVRAAAFCRRWRNVIAGDGGRFLRRLGSLHGASCDHVVGHYRVDERYGYPRPPGLNPVFVPSPSSSSPWADTVAARNLALDFLPRVEFGDCGWELADIRGGLLLLFHPELAPGLIICDPLRRCYRAIPRSAWFHGYQMLGAFLFDGEEEDEDEDDEEEDDDAAAGISLSNFRVTCALFRLGDRNARACAFSSAGGGWTSGGARSSIPVCRDRELAPIYFTGSGKRFTYWTVGDNTVLALDKDGAGLISGFVPDDRQYAVLRDKRHAAEYAYQLPWPPTIEACVS